MDPDELAKPGRVVVPCSLCIAVGFKDWIGRHNLVLKCHFLFFLFLFPAGHDGQVGDHFFRVLSFSSTRLTSDQHCVVFLVLQHVAISTFSNCPEVRRGFVSPLVHVDLANPCRVNWVTLVRVDHNYK